MGCEIDRRVLSGDRRVKRQLVEQVDLNWANSRTFQGGNSLERSDCRRDPVSRLP